MLVCACECIACGGQKRAAGCLPLQVLRTELQSSARALCAVHLWAMPPASLCVDQITIIKSHLPTISFVWNQDLFLLLRKYLIDYYEPIAPLCDRTSELIVLLWFTNHYPTALLSYFPRRWGTCDTVSWKILRFDDTFSCTFSHMRMSCGCILCLPRFTNTISSDSIHLATNDMASSCLNS